MKEILVRGKRNDTGEWTYGYFVSHDSKAYILEPEEVDKRIDLGGCLDCCQMHEVNPVTVGQFMGFTDINNNKIFEGDVLRIECGLYGCYLMCTIDIRNGLRPIEEEKIKGCDILGNIHDDPELLDIV